MLTLRYALKAELRRLKNNVNLDKTSVLSAQHCPAFMITLAIFIFVVHPLNVPNKK